jgi:hypothetical protein
MPDAMKPDSYPLGEMFASSWYLKIDDNIRVTSYNALASVRLEVRYRFVDCDGQIGANQEAQTPNTDRTAKSTIFVTPEGWLLGGEIFVSGAAPLIGQTYVVVEIVRGLGSSALPLQVIAAGYVSAKQPLPFPNTQMYSTLDGGGAIRSISGSTPAAGAEISETVPTGARWELLTFATTLITSVAAANRFPTLTLDDGASVYYQDTATTAHAASTTIRYVFAEGNGFKSGTTNNLQNGAVPMGNRLSAGHRIRTATQAIQVADQYSNVQYLVREWLEGA